MVQVQATDITRCNVRHLALARRSYSLAGYSVSALRSVRDQRLVPKGPRALYTVISIAIQLVPVLPGFGVSIVADTICVTSDAVGAVCPRRVDLWCWRPSQAYY